MKEKYIFDDFISYKSSHDKYYDLGSYTKVDKYGNSKYDSLFTDLLYSYKADKSEKREETEQEKEARLLREKAAKREAKIDEILKK
jgi:hypothetical protein